MSIAYVDSSVLVAIALGESGSEAVTERLAGFTRLYSSNLLEAELRSALVRESVGWSQKHTEGIRWIWTDRSLGDEMETILRIRYLKGADLWHLAAAVSFVPDPRAMTFVTLDERQRAVAAELGFQV
ncbi:MAG: PIN domain-containing protein [Acidobacteriota bacterium]|nr:PIN domain-containing protein [Acidobacteriota bacterium]MDE2711489.1 PIN domain-containing protein [Acidobacteriota bacterium]MXW71793.1 type II toxin-antitoxin system VapC family toxin [Acidobacteriota bacterium]MYE43301.1 type II toxin-antitoxin system VapC family toxin [Acidobacteriota bacterium]